MATTDKAEFVLLATDLTTRLAILPVSQSHFYMELSEPGSGEVKIPLDSTAAGLVTAGMFVQCYYRGSSRGGWFIDNIAKGQADASEGGGRWMSLSGRGALALLSEAIVWDDGTSAASRDFTGKTKAYILKTFIDEAQTRGGLAVLSYDFTATDDSASVAWTDSEDSSFTVGLSLLDLVRQFAETGIDFDINLVAGSFVLSAYKNGMGTDKSATQYFRVGTNCEEVKADERSDEVKNAYRVAWESGYLTVKDTTSITANRRREELLNIKQAQSSASATTYAAAIVDGTKDTQKSITVRIYDGVAPYLFEDYGMGDYVKLDVFGVETKYRILGIQASFDGVSYSNVVIDFNSIYRTKDLKLARDVGWLMNQWNNAHDADLLEVSYWAAIGDPSDAITSIDALYVVGRKVYIGGEFTRIGNLTATCMVSYDMDTGKFETLPAGSPTQKAVAITSVGTTIYFASGSSLFSYDPLTSTVVDLGQVLASVAPDLGGWIYGLANDGTDLYLCGLFYVILDINGDPQNSTSAAKYVIATSEFVSMGTDLQADGKSIVVDGSEIYVGGGSGVVGWVYQRDGSDFLQLGIDFDAPVRTLAVHPDGLLVGGDFTDYLTLWDGAAFTSITGLDGAVNGLAVFLTDIYAVGKFHDADGLVANHVAKYSAEAWSLLETGLNDTGTAIALMDDDVIAGGDFTEAGGKPALNVAIYFNNFEALVDYLENSSRNSFDMGAAIHNAPASAISDADEVPFWEDVSTALRKITWANIKATLKTYMDGLYVALTGNQSIDGVKTFTSFPVTPSSAPTTDYQAANKKYVDDNIGGVPGGADTEVQFNDSGAFGGEAEFTYDKTIAAIKLGVIDAALPGVAGSLMQGASGASVANFIETFGTGVASYITFLRGRGTNAAPTAVQADDVLGRIRGRGYDSNAGSSTTSTEIRLLANETHTTIAHGTRMELYTTPDGSVDLTKVITIGNDGNVNLEAGKTYNVGGAQHTQNASTVIIPSGLGTPTYDDVQDFLNLTRSAGRLTGGVVSKGTGATVSITPMDGMIFTGSTLGTSPLIYFKMPQQTDILGTGAAPNLIDNSVNWIYIDYAAGTPVYKATIDRSTINDYTMFTVARAWVSGADVEVQASGHSLYNKDRRAHNRLILKYGGMDRVSGGTITAHATALRLACDTGSWYIANTPYTTAAADTFKVWYRTGGGAWTESAELTLFSEVFDGGTSKVYEKYQNGTSLGTLTSTHYGCYWIFLCPEGDLYIVLGGYSDNKIGDAQARTIPASFPPYLINYGRLVGRVICKKTAAALYSVESVFSQTFTLSAAVDHASLANLAYGDSGHTGFVPAARTITATSPLTIAGGASADLSADRTIAVNAASTSGAGVAPQATAPAAGLYNYVGITNAETVYTNKPLFDATVPTTIAPSDAAAAGTATVAARRDHLHQAPATFPATAHNIFSTTHGDIAGAASPVDGDIIIGNVTPKWSKLAISIPGASLMNVLGVVNGELRPSWKAIFDATNPAAPGVAAPGTATTASHRDHVHAVPKLDDLATPDDNTDLNANTVNHGLLLKAVAPAANLMNVVGIINGETIWSNKAIFDATAPADVSTAAAAGTATTAAHRDHVHKGLIAPSQITASRAMNAVSGNVSYTGAGFTPRIVHVNASISGTLCACWGLFTATKQQVQWTQGNTGAFNSISSAYPIFMYGVTGGTDYQYCTLVSMDADGFTLAWVKGGTDTANITLTFMCEQ